MKVVLATPLYPPEVGGPATYAEILMRELPKRGIEVALVKFADVRHLPKVMRHFAFYERVLAASHDADLILALDPVSVGLPVMWAAKRLRKKFGVKIVGDYAWEQGRQRFGINDELDEFVNKKQHSFFVRRLQKIEARVAQSATRVIVPSEYLKKIVSAWGVPEEKIDVIYNGIDLPRALPSPTRPEGFLIVSSGRRVPWKGFEALECAVATHPSWHLFIASGLPRAEALGWVKAADVFVLNSRYEGLSHALLEAVALGTPVIATDAGGNREVIENDKTGLLIPPGDEAALESALLEVAKNPAAARSRAAAGQLRMREFSESAMIEKTVAILQSL